MNRYTQLTEKQRYLIEHFIKAGFSQTEISNNLGVHKSTISRELRRNSCGARYLAQRAQSRTDERRADNQKRVSEPLLRFAELFLTYDWSPQQVCGWLRENLDLRVSHQRLYHHVWEDRERGGNLYTHLRCGRKKKRPHGSSDGRGQILDRVSIEQRPEEVEQKLRVGHWELDTVSGSRERGCYLVTVVERKTRLTLVVRVESKNSDVVAAAVVKMLAPYKDTVHSITSDNGKEFARHKLISEKLEADFYFARPYRSGDRGLCENTIGLLRQYFAKGSDFSAITEEQIAEATERLNNRPRRGLGFKTPNQLFFGTDPELHFTFETALRLSLRYQGH